jgi:hypothetical protein
MSDDDEIPDFVCNKCQGFYTCYVVVDGLCICPNCEPDIYNAKMKGCERV